MKYLGWKSTVRTALLFGAFTLPLPVSAAQELTLANAKLMNETDYDAAEFYIKKAADVDWGSNILDTLHEVTVTSACSYDVKLVSEQEVFVFRNLTFGDSEELSLHEKNGLVYVTGVENTDSGKEADTEDCALRNTLDEDVHNVYTTVGLNVRTMPNTDADILETLALGTETSVYGETDDWYLIRSGEGYGYIFAEYVTDDKEEADRLVAQEKARTEAEAAARAAQAQAAQQVSRQPSDSSKKTEETGNTQKKKKNKKKKKEAERTEVSRENIPSCDDPDHGTTYITYSDGSVEVINY